MGRAPCCDKVGLKRGPWTAEEDQILIHFIQQHGHSNWRALPKQAGLLRCGKSCRLRWINYLKPDIKRGNFSKEEEDSIIHLHQMMGNRWSAIAARLPGRTDNEIKNVWHTHLKKRLNNKDNRTPKSQSNITKQHFVGENNNNNSNSTSANNYNNISENSGGKCEEAPNYSQQSYSSDDFSTITEVSSVRGPNYTENATNTHNYDDKKSEFLEELPIIDATFWSPQVEFSYGDFGMDFEFLDTIQDEKLLGESNNSSSMYVGSNNVPLNQGENDDFWFDIFVKAGEELELPDF